MAKTQRFTSPQNWYSLEYPRLWEMEIFEDIPAFFDPISGQGALQVFSVRIGARDKKPQELNQFSFLSKEKLEEKMLFFLESQSVIPEDGQLTVYQEGEVYLIPYEYYIKERFYMACMLQKKDIFLLTLYNCANKPDKKEAQTIGEIVKSINIRDGII